MAVLEMLSEMIRAVKLLRLVAFTELVHVVEVLGADVPLWRVWKLETAVAAGVGTIGGAVEGGFDTGERSAGPGVFAEMERVLVAFGFVFVLEAVRAVAAHVLFLGFVESTSQKTFSIEKFLV